MSLAGPAAVRAPLADLVDRVRGVVGRGLPELATAEEVGRVLAPALSVPDLLTEEQRRGDPERYTQHLLHAEDDGSFSLVALVWLPGQSTAVHDHVSWCTVGVLEGQESETLYRFSDDGALVVSGRDVNPTGSITALAPPGDIHRVTNCGSSTAISLHVYGADVRALGSSIRRTYEANP